MLIGGWAYWQSRPKVSAHEFVGQVSKVEGSQVYAKGNFILDKNKNLDLALKKEVVIQVSDKTKFVKTLNYLPGPKDLGPNGSFDFNKLKKEIVAGQLSDLTDNVSGLTIHAKSDINIYNKSKFTASEVDYLKDVSPK